VNSPKRESELQSYFVDESGDPTIFGSKHRIMLGQEGVSTFFMLGLLSVRDVASLEMELHDLRIQLINDPYFKDVPSMQPSHKKTACAFHAKDDVPEVRREVFKLLSQHQDLRFFAVIKDKRVVLDYVLNRNQSDPVYKYTPNDLYDFCVRRLFRDRLHKDNRYQITFAQRLQSDRTRAMVDQIALARARFIAKYGLEKEVEITVSTSVPEKCIALQAADYYLWALQRFYIYSESRYLEYLAPSIRLIMDVDDTRENPYGMYYSKRNPIALEKIPPLKQTPEI